MNIETSPLQRMLVYIWDDREPLWVCVHRANNPGKLAIHIDGYSPFEIEDDLDEGRRNQVIQRLRGSAFPPQ